MGSWDMLLPQTHRHTQPPQAPGAHSRHRLPAHTAVMGFLDTQPPQAPGPPSWGLVTGLDFEQAYASGAQCRPWFLLVQLLKGHVRCLLTYNTVCLAGLCQSLKEEEGSLPQCDKDVVGGEEAGRTERHQPETGT